MVDAPKLGTRWLARRGRHAGNEVEVAKATSTSVTFKYLGGGGNWGNQKTDDSRSLTLTTDLFLAQYAPKEAALNGTAGGTSYRRKAAPKERPVEVAAAQPLAMNGFVMTADTGLSIEVLAISANMARAWRERGGKNRKLSERRVIKLLGIIQRGEWELTGETIKLDADGTVRDGQHRLEAIARSGMTVQSVVVRNVKERAFDAIDTGASRTVADVLSIHGYGNRISLAAQVRALILIEASGRYQTGGRFAGSTLVTASRALAYAQAHPEVEETLRLGYQAKNAGLMGGAGLWGAMFTLFWRVDREALHLFVEKLCTGASLEADDPILRLRNRVFSETARKQRADNSEAGREMQMALIIKAWNLWRQGERIKQLTWHGQGDKNPEAFPVPI